MGRMMSIIAGLSAAMGIAPMADMHDAGMIKRSSGSNTYGVGNKFATKGKRHKSQKTRSNRRKAKNV